MMKNSSVKVHAPITSTTSALPRLGSLGVAAAALVALSGCGAAVLAPILLQAPLLGLRFFDEAGQPIIQAEAPGALGFSNVGDPVRLTVPASQPSQTVVFTLLDEDELLNEGRLTEQPAQQLLTLDFEVDASSTAVPNIDYVPFDTTLTVPVGATRAALEIDLIENLAMGERTLILNILEPAGGEYKGAPCCTTAILTLQGGL
jgi:hypothetical protein